MTYLTTWKGCTVSTAFADALKDLDAGTPGIPLDGIKGGWQNASDSASAGTHLRDAIDIGGAALTAEQRLTVQTEGEKRGIVFWIRGPAQGFAWHLHGIPNGGDVAPEAQAQLDDYRNHLDGLVGHRPYPRPSNYAYVDVTWENHHTGSASSIPSALTTEDDLPYSEADIIRLVTQSIRSEGVSGSGDAGHMLDAGYRQAFVEAVTASLRSEGVSGAADTSHNGAAQILAKLNDPAAIAAAVPADLARQVADELAKRLTN